MPPLDQPWLTTWYDRGPSPGERGNSVIIGHVDTRKVGAAVFYSLGKLSAGDLIRVTRTDGVTAVDAVALVTKAQFPASDIYGPSDRPSLRLITCGGDFDASRHSYLANTIVTATLTSWHATSAADHPAPLTAFIPNLPPPPAKAVVPHVKPKVATKPKASKPKAKKPKGS